MNYTFHLDTNSELIDQFVINSDQDSIFQCSNWAQIKSNWDSFYTSVTDGDEKIVGTALVLKRNMPLGKSLFYVPRGPVMDYTNKELVKFYLNELTKLAKQNKAIALRFDPAILSRKYEYTTRKEEHPYKNNDVIAYLKSLGAKHKGFTTMIEEATQPRFNAEMDVTEASFNKIPHKTTKRVSVAEHRGNVIYEGHEYLSDFATAMHYTEVRKQVALRNEEYFRNMANVYGDNAIVMVTKINFPSQIRALENSIEEEKKNLEDPTFGKKRRAVAQQNIDTDIKELEKLKQDYVREGKDEVITCGILAVYNKNLMEILYMGNNTDYLRTFPSYLLYYKCIERCKILGIKNCSFGGVEGTLNDGLTLFKSNWVMNVEEYIGEFNIILDSFIYTLFDKIYPHVLQLAAKLRGKR